MHTKMFVFPLILGSSEDRKKKKKSLAQDKESFIPTENIFFFLLQTQRENISKNILLHVFCKHKKLKWCQEKTKQKACFF